MNNGIEFWLKLWEEGRTAFHQKSVNSDLQNFWHQLALPPEQSKVLVPLCGKSLDMLWLVSQGMDVIGIELSQKAVEEFAQEQQLSFKIESKENSLCYSTKNLQIWINDIFTLNPDVIEPVDAIYDRAALIALPPQLRKPYVKTCLQWLKPKGKILLKTLEYDENQMQGPPYSVTHEEVISLYQDLKSKTRLVHNERQIEGTDPCFERGLRMASDSLWLIE